jgi:hypothetical protein
LGLPEGAGRGREIREKPSGYQRQTAGCPPEHSLQTCRHGHPGGAARQLTRNVSASKAGSPYTKEAAIAKTYATDTAMRVAADAVEIMGAYGYSRDAVAEKLMRDAKVTQIYEGTNQVQRLVISGQLLNA